MASNWIPTQIVKALLFLESRKINTFTSKEIYRIYSPLTKTHCGKPHLHISERTGKAGSILEE